MALKLNAIGKKIGPFTKEYTWKDTVLYALGVGAGFEDLDYCYEKDLQVIPSFAITTIYDLMPELATSSNVNLAGILHGEHELIFHNPIPSEGTLTTSGTAVVSGLATLVAPNWVDSVLHMLNALPVYFR